MEQSFSGEASGKEGRSLSDLVTNRRAKLVSLEFPGRLTFLPTTLLPLTSHVVLVMSLFAHLQNRYHHLIYLFSII